MKKVRLLLNKLLYKGGTFTPAFVFLLIATGCSSQYVFTGKSCLKEIGKESRGMVIGNRAYVYDEKWLYEYFFTTRTITMTNKYSYKPIECGARDLIYNGTSRINYISKMDLSVPEMKIYKKKGNRYEYFSKVSVFYKGLPIMRLSYCSELIMYDKNILLLFPDINGVLIRKYESIPLFFIRLLKDSSYVIDTIAIEIPPPYDRNNPDKYFISHNMLCVGGFNQKEKSFVVGFRVNDMLIKIKNIEFDKNYTAILNYQKEIYKAHSEYLSSIPIYDGDTTVTDLLKYVHGAGGYASIKYDFVNNKYYRIIELPTNYAGMDISKIPFSVIIMDKDLKVIDEIKFSGKNLIGTSIGFLKNNIITFQAGSSQNFCVEKFSIKDDYD